MKLKICIFSGQVAEVEEEDLLKTFKKQFIAGLKKVQDKDDIEIIKYCVAGEKDYFGKQANPVFQAKFTYNKETNYYSAEI